MHLATHDMLFVGLHVVRFARKTKAPEEMIAGLERQAALNVGALRARGPHRKIRQHTVRGAP